MPTQIRRPRMSLVHTNAAFRYFWIILQMTGLQPSKRAPVLLYRLYGICLNGLVTILFPLTLIVNIFHTSNLQQFYDNLTVTITDTMINLKFLNIFFVRSKLLLIEDILEVLDQRVSNVEERRVLKKAIQKAQNIFRVFAFVFFIAIIFSTLKVLIAKQRSLIFEAWFYLSWENSGPTYFFLLLYQECALIIQAVQNCANDSYPPAYLCVLTGHMRALELRVRRIGVPPQLLTTRAVPALDRNYHELMACIEDYLNILKLHGIIQEILSVCCLAQFICSATVQCFLALHFLYVVNDRDLTVQLFSLVFFIAVTLEAFVICCLAHIMRQQSEALAGAFYSCEWIGQLPKFKQNLLITLMRTQRPCSIYAGGYILVDLRTFLLLMKYAYSVFTILLRFK